jgi:hypothetical protein
LAGGLSSRDRIDSAELPSRLRPWLGGNHPKTPRAISRIEQNRSDMQLGTAIEERLGDVKM